MAKAQNKEMSFLDHLEELRWHLIRSLISIVVFSLVAFLAKDFIFQTVILGPAKTDFWTYRMLCKLGPDLCIEKMNFSLQNRTLGGQFTMHINAAFVIGLILAFPYTFWEIWSFIKPGLYIKEQSAASGLLFYVTVLFISGVLFGYYIVSPMSINFLANYSLDPSIENNFDLASYISTLTMMVLGSGLMFQLPVAVFILSKLGVMTPDFMRTYRRHAIVVILTVAAIITPPDVLSQIIISLPLFVLYEISIFISASVNKKRRKKEEMQELTYS
ncbi:twin-arginine translocase subunit TatC [Sporocytophaga sp.]|uniref:twin-arginine translocase subunit TatC n=1 Tax=Sporocytophaga sp. TaxID=2231183 RepID=UPI00345C41E0